MASFRKKGSGTDVGFDGRGPNCETKPIAASAVAARAFSQATAGTDQVSVPKSNSFLFTLYFRGGRPLGGLINAMSCGKSSRSNPRLDLLCYSGR